jgi:hypothetical protein
MVSGWHVDFAQHHESIGLVGIPRIAALVGAPELHIPNIIGLTYAPEFFPEQSVIVALPALLLASIMFTQSDYTVVLITHGFLIIVILSWMLFPKKKIATRVVLT